MIDLLVVGGGQAGLAAGAAAAARGLSAIVCEKTERPGGSAYFSAGILWTAPDVSTLASLLPDGDPELGRVLVEGFEPAVAAERRDRLMALKQQINRRKNEALIGRELAPAMA